MPGNEIGDRVHNFFPQENLPQGLHHSAALDGNWPVPSDSPRAGNQRDAPFISSGVKTYNVRQSDGERGQFGNHLLGQNGLNFPQLTLRPEFGNSHSPVQQPNVNGFLAGDTNFNQDSLNSRGLFNYGLRQTSAPENQSKSSRAAASGSSMGFDLFGGQQQMNNQQLSMMQSLRHQLSGMNDVQQLQQQVMFMKMQEFQRQQQLQQADVQQQNAMNQIPSFSRQASGSHTLAMVNGSQSTGGSGNHWPNDPSTNWLQRNTQSPPGSSNLLGFSQNQSPTQRPVDVVPQLAEQSLYGVPVSGSRGSLNQFSHMTTDKSHVQQLVPFANTSLGNSSKTSPVQVNAQNGISFAKQRFQVENSFGPVSGQTLSSVGPANFHQGIPSQRNSPQQEFHGMQMLDVMQAKLSEKAETQNTPSQEDIALDPTEERILFGSDDNIWAAFGKSQEDSNPFDGEGSSGFASLQSGSWSALMQSAVAETCSSDSGLKEEWSGLNFHNADPHSGNQHVRASNDGGKQPPFVGGKLAISSSTSGVVPGSNESNTNKNYQNALRFQQFGGKSHSETGLHLHANSAQGLAHSSHQGGQQSNGPAHNFITEAGLVQRNASQTLDMDIEKSSSHVWRPENMGSRQVPSKHDGSNAFGSFTSYQDANAMVHGDGNSLRHPWANDRMPQRAVPNGGGPWRLDSVGDPVATLEQVKHSAGNTQVNNEVFASNNPAVILESSSIKTGEGITSSYVSNWKIVEPVVRSKGNETNRSLQDDNVSVYNDPSKGLERENSNNQDNSNDSHRSSSSHHASAGGPREKVYSDAIDSRTKSARLNYNQTDIKNSAPRKFQYHPMGEIDELDPSRGMKQPVHSQSISHCTQPKFFGQIPNNFGDMEKRQPPDHQMSTKAVNEVISHSQGSVTGSLLSASAFNRTEDTQAQKRASQLSQNMLELLHKVDQSGENGAPMQTNSSLPGSSSEHVEKSDGSGGRLERSSSFHSQGFSLQLGPPPQKHSIPNNALPSHSYLQTTNSTHPSYAAVDIGHEGSSQSVPASVHLGPSSSEISQNLEVNRPSVLGQLGSEVYKAQGNFSASVNPSFLSRGHAQNLETVSGSGQVSRSSEKEAYNFAQKRDPRNGPPNKLSAETSLHYEAGGSINNSVASSNTSLQYGMRNLPDDVAATLSSARGPLPISQPISGFSSQGSSRALPSSWTNIVAQQHLLGAQFRKQLSQSYQSTRVDSDPAAYFNQSNQDTGKGEGEASEVEVANDSANSPGVRSEEEESVKNSTGHPAWPENVNLVQKEDASQGMRPGSLSDGSSVNSASTQRDIEAFGRTLRPNNFQQKLSSLNPMRSMPDLDNDPSHLAQMRIKGQDDSLAAQLVAPTVRQSDGRATGDAIIPSNRVGHPEDSSISSFSGSPNNAEKNLSLEHGNLTSQGLLALGQNVSQSSNNLDHVNVDRSKIGPQMAPSWFNQYGAFRNGQIMPLYDSNNAGIAMTGAQFSPLGDSSNATRFSSVEQVTATALDVNKVGSIQQSASPASVSMEHFSSQILPANISNQHPVLLRTKKRKSATSELIPWYKEVSHGSRKLQTTSVAELEWSKAAKRLTQKVEEDAEFLDDGPQAIRSKRRLILTAQLMQQLIPSPPAAILSMDAKSDYASVAYSVSRLALGEACSLVSSTNEESNMSTDSTDRLPGVHKRSDKLDQFLLKVAEEFTDRSRKLESNFLRVDKGASLLDLVVEYQDLEKFSVINRFAKFHGRGQAENAETASSSDAVGISQKLCPQRYVTALPLPRSLPTGVQCHSL